MKVRAINWLLLLLLVVIHTTESTPLIGNSPQELIPGDFGSISNSFFNATRDTKIIIHGWTKSAQETPNPQLRSAYLDTGDYNIISVDWQEYAALDYIASRKKVPIVGADVANLIDYLHQHAGLSFSSLVVIGHSLGAHCAGYAGKYVRGRLSYIVGLDPAFPLYSYNKPNERLNSTDADYVETIQTNGGVKGFLQPIGSASFYANWGRKQPGCGSDLDGSCAHLRSVLYYADAIRGYKYTPIYSCNDYEDIQKKTGCGMVAFGVDIGEPTKIFKRNGIFYFTTTSEEPFGHKLIRKQTIRT